MPLDDAGRRLVEEYKNLASTAAWQYWRKAPRADLDELKAIAFAALCQAVARFPDYQRENGYALDDHSHLVAFLMRRIRGSILDWARSEDWVTRSARRTLKILEDARPGGGSIAELAEAAGIAEAEVRAALAAVAAKPVSFAPTGSEAEWSPGGIADEAEDVESKAVVSEVLAAAVHVIQGLPWQSQLLVVLRYYQGLELDAVAAALGITSDQAVELHRHVILAAHDAMLRAAADGCACGRNGSCSCSAR